MIGLRATYRLQLGDELGFDRARELVPYFRRLGVSHLYLSPIMTAREGSSHGYDVTDPDVVAERLGGERGLRELAACGLGLVIDVVANHMGACEENRFWADPQLRRRFFDIDERTGRHRRFFDIDGLAAVRQEDPQVFAATHGKTLELVRDGVVEGLRIDHLDGLADPAGYLRHLRSEGALRVWVEKILGVDERLRDWPVLGTVGYEFLNDVTALFVDQAGADALSELYAEVTGEGRQFWEVAREAREEQVRTVFAPEVQRLEAIAPLPDVAGALARLPVYRTYVEPLSGEVTDEDRGAIAFADMKPQLARALLLEAAAPPEFVVRFQQTSPAIAAKGVEDTAFYRYSRLLALNEVGGDPGRFGLDVETFHARNRERGRRFPQGLLATSTHDTKRSGDVRARIGMLAAMPARWREHVLRWRQLNAPLREGGAPDAAEEYWIYQTLAGAWPLSPERLSGHMLKALREAGRNSSWLEPDEGWEERVQAFCRRLLEHRPFLDDFEPFARELAAAGRRAALGAVALKLTCPGVPDIYQGEELEQLTLVDPDNRAPVDWDRRRAALDALDSGDERDPKLALTVALLELRARRPEPFESAYTPLPAGPTVCAFLRGDAEILVAVRVREGGMPSLVLGERAQGEWRDVLGGSGELRLERLVPFDELLGPWGIAVLERVG